MSQGFIGGLQVVRRPHCRFISLAFALLIKSDTDIPVGQSRPRGGGGGKGGEGESLLYPLGGLWLGLGWRPTQEIHGRRAYDG